MDAPRDAHEPALGRATARDIAAQLDGLVEELAPGGLDWRDLVRAYPLPALLLAGLGGFFLARRRGAEVVEALSSFAATQVSQGVNEFLGDEVL